MLLVREFLTMALVKTLSSEIDPRNDESAEGLKSDVKKYVEVSLGIIRPLLQLRKSHQYYICEKKMNSL